METEIGWDGTGMGTGIGWHGREYDEWGEDSMDWAEDLMNGARKTWIGA